MSETKKLTTRVTTAKPPSPGQDPYPPADNMPAAAPEPAEQLVPAPTPPALPADLTPEEVKSFEEMNAALRAKVLEMRELMLHEREGLLDSRYQLGRLVLEVKKDVETYGNLSDIHMAQFFGEGGKTVVAEARRLRERYSPEEFARIKSMCNPHNGARITFKHLAVLLRIEDKPQADKVLTQCLQAGWSGNELATFVNKKLREQSGAPEEPSRPRPSNLLGLAENAAAYTIDFKKQYDEVWGQGGAFIDAYNAIPEDKIDEALVAKLKELKHQAQVVAEAEEYLAVELGRLISRAEGTIGDRRKGDGKAKAQVRTIEDDEEDQDDEE